MVPTEPQWQNELRWARNELKKQKYLDETAPYGVWRLTPRGMQVAKQTEALDLKPEERRLVTRKKTKKIQNEVENVVGSPSLRQALLRKLGLLTNSTPLEDLDLLIDIAHAVRYRSLSERSEQ